MLPHFANCRIIRHKHPLSTARSAKKTRIRGSQRAAARALPGSVRSPGCRPRQWRRLSSSFAAGRIVPAIQIGADRRGTSAGAPQASADRWRPSGTSPLPPANRIPSPGVRTFPDATGGRTPDGPGEKACGTLLTPRTKRPTMRLSETACAPGGIVMAPGRRERLLDAWNDYFRG